MLTGVLTHTLATAPRSQVSSSASRSPQSHAGTPRSNAAKKTPRAKRPSRKDTQAQRIRSVNMLARFRPTISMMCAYQLDVEVIYIYIYVYIIHTHILKKQHHGMFTFVFKTTATATTCIVVITRWPSMLADKIDKYLFW